MRAILVVAALMLLPRIPAHADAFSTRAAELYDEGAAAYDAGDYNRALHALREADSIAPNDVALELALRAAERSTLPVVAMEMAYRAKRRSEHLQPWARAVRDRFQAQVGVVRVHCSGCVPSIDGAPAVPGEPRFVSPGNHIVEARVGSRSFRRAVDVAAGESRDIQWPEAQDLRGLDDEEPMAASVDLRAPAPRPPSDRAVARIAFWAGLGISAVLGAGTALSALDTRARYEDFQRSPGRDSARAGERSQLRTNVLAAITATASLSTLVAGVLALAGGPEPQPATFAAHAASH